MAESASWVPTATPKIMYPMWLIRVKDSMRLMSICASAPRMPTTMVSSATHIRRSSSRSPGKSTVSVRMIEYTPTLVSRPANTAVTGAEAVG
ncbi:hypothetical protein H488_0107010 [Kocuria sp. UCD-OTCP]|nr:hypothetical protein H488_0107010 [Kocuria sp. UCD-OTCP]